MKDNNNKTTTTARRLAAVCCVMLSASAFPVGGNPFRQHKSSSTTSIIPAASTTTTTTATPNAPLRQPVALEASPRRSGSDSSSSSSFSPSSSSDHHHHPHHHQPPHHARQPRSLWNVFAPRSLSSLKAATGISPNITTATTTTTDEEATTTTSRTSSTTLESGSSSSCNNNNNNINNGLATAFFPSLASLATFASPAAAAASTAPTTTVTGLDDWTTTTTSTRNQNKKDMKNPKNDNNNNHHEGAGTATTTTTTTATAGERPPSVHYLRLRDDLVETTEQEKAQQYKAQKQQQQQKNDPPSPQTKKKSNSKSNLKIHTYVDDRGRVWKGLNTPRDKFEAFLKYNNIMVTTKVDHGGLKKTSKNDDNDDDNDDSNFGSHKHKHNSGITTHETSTLVDAATANARRQEWRDLWKKGQLLTERTEYLAVYPSDDKERRKTNNNRNNNIMMTSAKRGGFADLLYLYTQRLLSFLRDETEDEQKSILEWLHKEFGRTATNRLQASELAKYPPSEQMAYLKEFLEWFRGEFPYYYDRCGNCGASIREDVANNAIVSDDAATDGAADRGHKTFLGYVYPLDAELKGKASRTELYKCHKCDSCTRFPRFNSAWHVMEHKRGRCGEYSMLLYRMMRALGHEARWVVDWADHVWVEAYLDRAGEWIHLDPCEAAVRENYLYQGWGKKQTYVLGFYAPRVLPDATAVAGATEFSVQHTPLIEDITQSYTSDSWEEIQARRDESEDHIEAAMLKSTAQLRERLAAGVYDDL